MQKVLLSVHVLAAIIFVGPVTVAVSLFPRYARTALAVDDPSDEAVDQPANRAAAVMTLLHRISRVYAVLGLSVPVAGLALGGALGVLGESWLVVSTALTAAAAALLAFVVLPAQRNAMVALGAIGRDGAQARAICLAGSRRLAAMAGLFGVLWAVVVVLMVLRPGSTTGV